MSQRYFTARTFEFLRDLAAHNDTGWFAAHRPDYQRWVRGPAAALLADLRPHLEAISPHLRAGAVLRIRRDVRLGEDRAPYKTYTGFYCRHAGGEGRRAPGIYLRVGPGGSFLRVGITAPRAATAGQVRQSILADPGRWEVAARRPPFTDVFAHDGSALARPPAGVDPAHPMAADLMRREFTVTARLSRKTVTSHEILEALAGHCRAAAPFLGFLCQATGLD